MTRKRTLSAAFAGYFALLLAVAGSLLLGGSSGQPAEAASPGTTTERLSAGKVSPFARPGMWIWYVSAAERGDPGRIIRKAKAHGIGTLYIKSADGTDTWSQFTKSLVRRFQRAGLDVCGWHYVYGRGPAREARASAYAKRQGADCFVIDAETEYEGDNQYAKADRYIRKLRDLVGRKFKLGLSTFPYTHYHPALPYSVFLGPGGATANLPQVYWKTIGDTARESVSITWIYNSLYGRKIYPLGQTYLNPSRSSVRNFRRYIASYDTAPSWWSWQHTGTRQWRALRGRAKPFRGYSPERSRMVLRSGSRGDQVVWLQQHLRGAGYTRVPASGIFGKRTRKAVRAFQRSRSLGVDGVVGTTTWNRLLRVDPVRIRWAGRRSLRSLGDREPLSADLPAIRNELAGGSRRGPAQSG